MGHTCQTSLKSKVKFIYENLIFFFSFFFFETKVSEKLLRQTKTKKTPQVQGKSEWKTSSTSSSRDATHTSVSIDRTTFLAKQ